MNHPARLLLFLLLILCIPLAACAEAVESPRASASAPANPAGTARPPGPSSDRPGPISRKTNAPPRPRLARADRGGAPLCTCVISSLGCAAPISIGREAALTDSISSSPARKQPRRQRTLRGRWRSWSHPPASGKRWYRQRSHLPPRWSESWRRRRTPARC